MKALESSYNGYRFRSRLEARWAVFMDSLRVKYDYEREAYDLDGVAYLPDFWLPSMRAFIEVKPIYPTDDEVEKVGRLAEHSGFPVFVSIGPPDAPEFGNSESMLSFLPGVGGCDCQYWWCECPRCNRVSIQFNGRADRIKCECPKSPHGDKGYNYDSPRLIRAYEHAKGYRFEPGAVNHFNLNANPNFT